MKNHSELSGRTIIVTAGGTIENIDPVRYISNRSSGRMGIAIADAAHSAGHTTVLICGNVEKNLVKDKPYRVIFCESTLEMLSLVRAELFERAVLIMAAAPADYRVTEYSTQKIKKTDNELILKLVKNPDILKSCAQLRTEKKWNSLLLAGFAAETENLEEYALKKLKEKDLDLICANDVSETGSGFSSENNRITIYFRDGKRNDLGFETKQNLAVAILDAINDYLLEKNNPSGQA